MIIFFDQPIRIQPWRLLGSGLLRMVLGAAIGGFALGLIRGGMLTPIHLAALLGGFLLIPVALFLLVVGFRRVRAAIHRRLTTGRWRSGPVERILIL